MLETNQITAQVADLEQRLTALWGYL